MLAVQALRAMIGIAIAFHICATVFAGEIFDRALEILGHPCHAKGKRPAMQKEIEAKFHFTDKAAMRRKLAEAGLSCTRPETLMRRCNVQFSQDFAAGKKWGRVRDEGDKITMTVKEIIDITQVDGTLETELVVQDFETACRFMTACGLYAMSLHENKRETWKASGVVATLDTWPDLDPILEIEADSVERIDAVCAALGLDRADAFYKPVDFIYGQKYNVAPEVVLRLPEITFDNPPYLSLKKSA